MNTNNLKRFAREARIKLIDQVGRKLEFVLSNTDPVFIDTNASQIQSLKNKIQALGKEQVIDTVAYTWFNRLMALRFMDANGYTSPKVVTPVVGKSPEILQNALSGQIDEALKINRQRLNDLLDGRVVIADAQTEAYKMLLIAACNQWHTAMPFMFERISDYTELLLPDDLLSINSIVADIREGMSDDDCQEEELIGWLYQFYIADKKDDVFEGLKKNIKITAENIPAATQLFTPRWIVRYMVENTLGKLWLTLKPESKLRQYMPYYIEAPEGNTPAPLPEGIKGVTDITFLDPCQGSGHVLVYAFDLFTKIYEEEGFNTNEIPALILEHNLFGIDIDERAAQLAAFALTMKARSYYSRFLRKPVQPHVVALENVNEETIKQSVKLPITIDGNKITEHKDLSLHLLTQADNFGSLIQIAPEETKAIQVQEGSIWQGQQQNLKTQAEYLSRQYHCVVTNPPYMGSKSMEKVLLNFCSKFYPTSKADLYATFIVRCGNFCKVNGRFSLINQHQWLFNEDYKYLRSQLLNEYSFESLLHLGPRTFPEISGEVVQNVTFVLLNNSTPRISPYYRLVSSRNKELDFLNNKVTLKDAYFVLPSHFNHFPDLAFGYWINENVATKLKAFPKLESLAEAKKGFYSGDDSKFIRYWFEVSLNNISINCIDEDQFNSEGKTFAFVSKGGGYQKWYGNHYFICNWSNRGKGIKSIKDSNGKQKSRTQNLSFNFKPGITWNAVSSSDFCCRYVEQGHLFTDVGPTIFEYKDPYYLIAYLQSDFGNQIFKLYCPTLKFEVGKVQSFPVYESISKDRIIALSRTCVELAKEEWDFRESSKNFKVLDFISKGLLKNLFSWLETRLIDKIELFETCTNKIDSIINNELNIPILREQTSSDLYREETIFHPESNHYAINEELVIKYLFSYSIGCLFGRYSLDKPGLILANQGETLQDFLKQIPNPSFMPDEDNIIPVLEGEWFNDDIVGRFKLFLKAAFGEEHFEENLKYIEDTIGKDIRKYFVKDFYIDHIKRYKKRPIYWMFSSPKGHFKALIYMHRYTPDLCSKMLTDYLQSYIHKLEAAQQNKIAESLREDLPARDKTAATKEADRFAVMIKDCKEYAQTLYAVATKKITIDLDDGVKVNYQKFKEVVVPIKGLEKDEE